MKLTPINDSEIKQRLGTAMDAPSVPQLSRSYARVREWFNQTAPFIQWDRMDCPLGRLFVGVSRQGLCAVDFGRDESAFLGRFDRQARLEKSPKAVSQAIAELREYFSGARKNFTLPVDLSALTAFQRSVLETACRIPSGQVWTYQRVAREMHRPKSSRPVGQALASNPIPIVIPCHRVIASDGSLGGYSGGSGIEAKRWLLRLEGALS